MAQDLNSERVRNIASELAAATGQDMESAVISAVEEKLARLDRPRAAEPAGDIDALFRRLTEMPVRDTRTPEEIIGYDENGLPA
jgi:antitoxin VapB